MIRRWWRERAAGERRALAAGAAFLFAVAWYLLLAEPLAREHERARSRLQAADSLVREMARVDARVRQIRRQDAPATGTAAGAELLSRLLREAGLVPLRRGGGAAGAGMLVLRLEPCPFERLLPFLISLRRHRIALQGLDYGPGREVELEIRLR